MNVHEGQLIATGLRFAVVVSRFNSLVTEQLLAGALDVLRRHGAEEAGIDVYRCPGTFELPALLRRVARSGRYDAVVALGAVIRGGTPHFEYVAAEASKGVAQVAFEAEGTMVDLVLDTRPQSGTISLVGQVVDKGGAKIVPRQVAVIVWTETGKPLAETSANEFGEFQLEFAAQDRLRLSVEIAGQKPIRIPPMNLNSPDVMRSVT